MVQLSKTIFLDNFQLGPVFYPSKPFQPSLMFVVKTSGLYYKRITIVMMPVLLTQ